VNYRLLLLALLVSFPSFSAVWQWSVQVRSTVSTETNEHPTAFLWMPENCKKVRAVVIGQHNMQEEGILEHPAFRKALREAGIAEIWITPGLDPLFNPEKDSKIFFEEILEALAKQSGYTELAFAPVIPIGHSAYATYPWTFAAWHPDRTLAVISVHGDAPRTHLTGCGKPNHDWQHRNTNGVPGLMVMGEYEWWEDRLIPAIQYKNKYPEAPVSLLADAGHGHFDHSDRLVEYLALFIKKAAHYRLEKKPNGDRPPVLRKTDPQKGYLADRWYPDQRTPASGPAPYSSYKGDKSTAFWYFDREMAELTEKYYAQARGKQNRSIGFRVNGRNLTLNEDSHARYAATLNPMNTGLTFTVSAFFTNSLKQDKIAVDRICGPVRKLDDSTFRVEFYRMGLNNRKRTHDIWLIARHEGDHLNKSAVQQLNLKFPYPKTEGKPQKITFLPIPGSQKKVKSIPLTAHSDSRLPVSFYVKQGPAEIENGELRLTRIPPRTKFPVKVTVVAWQYGNPEYRTAEPVEQSFYIGNRKSERSPGSFSALDREIRSWIDSGYYAGAAVKIIPKNQPVFEEYYGGYSDTTALHVASAGKWVAAAVIAVLADQGKLSWDDKVSRYIPEITDGKKEATLRQLFSHTAGYPDYQPEGKRRDDYPTLQEAVSQIAPLPADTLPGTRFKYGGLAMQVAGRMAEIATGKDWETLFRENIARLLGMEHSYFVPVSTEPGFNPMLGGGFRTCLKDYMNFLRMMADNGRFNGKQVLSAEVVAEIEADQVKTARVIQPEYVLKSKGNAHTAIYGLGVWREELDENGRATLISSPGWAGSYPFIDRKTGTYGFILAKISEKGLKEGFSGFYSSARLSVRARETLNN